MTITESIKFNKLQEENEKLKNKLAEKDKEIELMNEQCDGAIREILEQQLYKEDFNDLSLCNNCNMLVKWYVSKVLLLKFKNDDNSKYDKLPSKDVK